jgi:hypothetical protein
MGFNTVIKAPREIRRDVNTATPDDIISNRVAKNARYYPVRDCSMLGIAMYYIRDILYNCSGYNRFRIKPSYPLLIRRIAG